MNNYVNANDPWNAPSIHTLILLSPHKRWLLCCPSWLLSSHGGDCGLCAILPAPSRARILHGSDLDVDSGKPEATHPAGEEGETGRLLMGK